MFLTFCGNTSTYELTVEGSWTSISVKTARPNGETKFTLRLIRLERGWDGVENVLFGSGYMLRSFHVADTIYWDAKDTRKWSFTWWRSAEVQSQAWDEERWAEGYAQWTPGMPTGTVRLFPRVDRNGDTYGFIDPDDGRGVPVYAPARTLEGDQNNVKEGMRALYELKHC